MQFTVCQLGLAMTLLSCYFTGVSLGHKIMMIKGLWGDKLGPKGRKRRKKKWIRATQPFVCLGKTHLEWTGHSINDSYCLYFISSLGFTKIMNNDFIFGKIKSCLLFYTKDKKFYHFFFFFFFCLFAISWAAPTAYGDSQARGLIGAVATSLHQSHSNAGSEPHLQPPAQLTAMLDR